MRGEQLVGHSPLLHYSMLSASGYPLPSCSPAELDSVSPDESLLPFLILKLKSVDGIIQEQSTDDFSYTLAILPT